jgi:acetyl esterase/lipase
MKRLLPALLSVFIALPFGVRAASAPLALWPGEAPGEKGDIGEETDRPQKPGAKPDDVIRLTNVTRPTITLFPAPADKATGTAVIVCPGGGYNILAWNKEGTEVCEWLNSIGVTGVLLKYRVPKRAGLEKHAPMLQDAQRALGLVRHRAREFSIDPQRIGIMGFSAGGHLSATASNNYTERTYPPIDDADKVSCRPDFALLIYPAYLTVKSEADKIDLQGSAPIRLTYHTAKNEVETVAPELPVTKDTPPTFLVMTQDDGVRVEGALLYYLALKNAKVPVEMHLYPTGGHGYGLRPSEHAVSTWPARAVEWMKVRGLAR